jgi:hypothetical protein
MMATMQDSLTPKRNYLESRIRHHAGSAGISIDDLSWRRPPDQDVSELTITISGKRQQWIIPHTNDPLGFALFRATNKDSDELAKTIVRDLTQ